MDWTEAQRYGLIDQQLEKRGALAAQAAQLAAQTAPKPA
jgi:enoyl-CoA hydratase/carnithine racemase